MRRQLRRNLCGRRHFVPGHDLYKRLSLRVLEIAVKDAQRGDLGAVWWLQSGHAEPFIFFAGFSPDRVRRGLKHAGLIVS